MTMDSQPWELAGANISALATHNAMREAGDLVMPWLWAVHAHSATVRSMLTT
jgi:hypothetical protein